MSKIGSEGRELTAQPRARNRRFGSMRAKVGHVHASPAAACVRMTPQGAKQPHASPSRRRTSPKKVLTMARPW